MYMKCRILVLLDWQFILNIVVSPEDESSLFSKCCFVYFLFCDNGKCSNIYIRLKFEEETSEVLRLEHSSVWC